MGSLAQLARAAGHKVTGSDKGVYPPMSTQLERAGIGLIEGFSEDQIRLKPDIFVIGNVISRGNPLMEAILDAGLPYTSGPQWLSDHILGGRWTLAVAGTHGKTTTASMLAWILEYAGMAPGYLIGGVPTNFETSARLGQTDFFVIEADEYDTAFFDKRSKFIHYQPNTLVINNLEFDHADIFPDLAAIQRQFHHVIRTVPRNGMVIYPQPSIAVEEVIQQGCWSEQQTTSIGECENDTDWRVQPLAKDGSSFSIHLSGRCQGNINWALTGQHNMMNALGAIAAARHVGVLPALSCEALDKFLGVKRRMELLDDIAGIKIYDDFAHHPTAIETTLAGLRAQVGAERVLAIIEPRSNTMRQGVHRETLSGAVKAADQCYWFQPSAMSWELKEALGDWVGTLVFYEIDEIIAAVIDQAGLLVDGEKLHVVIMSNGGFDGIHQRLLLALRACYTNEK